VKTFAAQTLEALGSESLDYLLLNAALGPGGESSKPTGSKWREIQVVNAICKFDPQEEASTQFFLPRRSRKKGNKGS